MSAIFEQQEWLKKQLEEINDTSREGDPEEKIKLRDKILQILPRMSMRDQKKIISKITVQKVSEDEILSKVNEAEKEEQEEITQKLDLDLSFNNNILSNTIKIYDNIFNKLFSEKKYNPFNNSEYSGMPDSIEHVIEDDKKVSKIETNNNKKKFNILKGWNWVTVITKFMFKIAAYLAYNKVLKIKNLNSEKLQPKELAEIYVDLIYKYIEQLFTSTGIISTFGTLLPGGQFLKSGSDLIFRYYKQYILLTEKYFEIEFIKNHFNLFNQHNLNSSVLATNVIKSKYEKLLTIFNNVLTSAISGGKSKTTKQKSKTTKQKSKTKKQNKKAKQKSKTTKQKSKTKKQNKKAKQNMIKY